MLGLLEVGAVALVVAVLLLAVAATRLLSTSFGGGGAAILRRRLLAAVGVLLVIGFGAKLGLLPFYEWFPAAYGAGSGASGALMSGVVLNAAFYGLSRGLLEWAPGPEAGRRRRHSAFLSSSLPSSAPSSRRFTRSSRTTGARC